MHRTSPRHLGTFIELITPARHVAGVLLLGVALAAPCSAESFTSSASSAGSASVGSVSDSFRGSSRSSTGGDKKLANGNYRIVDIAEVADRSGMTRVTLQLEQGDDQPVQLDLPTPTFARQSFARGDTVVSTQRVYGYEFARGDTREAFFLVLADDWRADLDPKLVTL